MINKKREPTSLFKETYFRVVAYINPINLYLEEIENGLQIPRVLS